MHWCAREPHVHTRPMHWETKHLMSKTWASWCFHDQNWHKLQRPSKCSLFSALPMNACVALSSSHSYQGVQHPTIEHSHTSQQRSLEDGGARQIRQTHWLLSSSVPLGKQRPQTIAGLAQVIRGHRPICFCESPYLWLSINTWQSQSIWERKKPQKEKTRKQNVHGIVPGFFGGGLCLCVFFSPIRNDPKKTHKQDFGTGHPPSPGTIPQICLCLCVFSFPDQYLAMVREACRTHGRNEFLSQNGYPSMQLSMQVRRENWTQSICNVSTMNGVWNI